MKLSVALLQVILFFSGALAAPIDERRGEAATDLVFLPSGSNWHLKREEATKADSDLILIPPAWGLKREEAAKADDDIVFLPQSLGGWAPSRREEATKAH